MADVTINYKGESIASLSASGTKTLETEGKYCEDDIEVVYVSPGGGGSTLGTKTITANDTYDASDDDLDGYSQVTVNVPASAVDTGTKSINTNGTHDVTGYASASVSVPTGTARTSADLTASGATVTAPAGLYAEAATKSVASGSATTPATTITANPSISVDSSTGVITASTSATQSVTPTVSAGYVSSGTAGTITVSGSNTSNLTTQAAQTIHPSTSDQTIASGKYLTGAQTVKGVLLTNLDAGNIKKDVVVKVGDSSDDDCVTSVTGTYEGGGGGGSGLTLLASGSHTCTGDPRPSLNIPVTYTGTPAYAYVVADEILANTNQSYCFLALTANMPFAQYLQGGKTGITSAVNTSGNLQTNAINGSNVLESDKITISRANNTYLIQPNVYNWYIYGVTA